MHEYEPVQGLMWSANAISTAEWTGVRLKDLLTYCGVDLTDERIKHIHFEGLDKDPVGAPYAASIPKEKVLNDFGDVLIAFQISFPRSDLSVSFSSISVSQLIWMCNKLLCLFLDLLIQ